VKTEVFAELDDPVLFPRLSEAKMERLATRGVRRVYEQDELLFEQGQRDAPFFVIEDGTVDIIDRRPNEELWFARMDGGTFIGDVSSGSRERSATAPSRCASHTRCFRDKRSPPRRRAEQLPRPCHAREKRARVPVILSRCLRH
jgi:CRP-like cAMP-binding protein